MAQGNMLLGMARGSVGDVTFARSARKQVSRARNRKPNNPRTLAQCKQRVLMKTAALAYQLFQKDIADQTFEGAKNARENQQKFIAMNIAKLRENQAAGNSLYAGKEMKETVVNRYILSNGTLYSGFWVPGSLDDGFALAKPNGSLVSGSELNTTITYRQFCELIGIPVGSQLTAVAVKSDMRELDDGNYYYTISMVNRFRLILSPSDGDVDKALFTGTGALTINDPNPKNVGNWTKVSGETNAGLGIVGMSINIGALFASHFDKKWRYSDSVLSYNGTPSSGQEEGDIKTGNNFDEAVDSWLRAGMSESEEYTRQAE